MALSGVAVKDAFPTPDMNDKDGNQVVWAGPGLTVMEFATIKIAAGFAQNYGAVMEEDTVADMSYKLAKAVCARLDQGEDWTEAD